MTVGDYLRGKAAEATAALSSDGVVVTLTPRRANVTLTVAGRGEAGMVRARRAANALIERFRTYRVTEKGRTLTLTPYVTLDGPTREVPRPLDSSALLPQITGSLVGYLLEDGPEGAADRGLTVAPKVVNTVEPSVLPVGLPANSAFSSDDVKVTLKGSKITLKGHLDIPDEVIDAALREAFRNVTELGATGRIDRDGNFRAVGATLPSDWLAQRVAERLLTALNARAVPTTSNVTVA